MINHKNYEQRDTVNSEIQCFSRAALEEPLPTTVGVVRSLTCCSERNSHLSQENSSNHAPEQLVVGLFHPTPEGGHNTAKDTGVSGQKRTTKRPGSIRALRYLGSCFPLPGAVYVMRWKAKRPRDKVQQFSEFNHLNSASCFRHLNTITEDLSHSLPTVASYWLCIKSVQCGFVHSCPKMPVILPVCLLISGPEKK